jgi:hypothetical protein
MACMRVFAMKAVGILLSVGGLVCSTPGLAASEAGIKLGILEDLPGHYAGQSHFRAVRVVFQQEGREWRAYPSDCRDPMYKDHKRQVSKVLEMGSCSVRQTHGDGIRPHAEGF